MNKRKFLIPFSLLMLILALCAFFAGFSDVDLDNALSPFSLSHPLGTDIYGRDLLERLALGTLISTCLAFCITAISAVLGVCLGFLMSKSGILSFISTSFSNVLKSLSSVIVALFLSAIFGPGFLTVAKILEGSKTPVSGQIMLEYGNIAKDLALYYTRSVETPSLFYISIRFDQKGRVWGAGGIFIQALPGCPESLLEELQDKAGNLGNMGLFLSEGNSAEEYIMKEFDVWKPEHIGHTPVGFSCPCSREHFATYLKGLPENEKKAILEGEFPLVLECLNCGSDYGFDKDEIERIFTEEK